jgi:hypothetical protein
MLKNVIAIIIAVAAGAIGYSTDAQGRRGKPDQHDGHAMRTRAIITSAP